MRDICEIDRDRVLLILDRSRHDLTKHNRLRFNERAREFNERLRRFIEREQRFREQ